jgi:hypothetical protein
MTRINDYLWQLPHTPTTDDPADVDALQQDFNAPLVALLEEPFTKLGYELKGSEVMVKLDEKPDNTANTYYASVRFIHYVQPDILTRVHFQHNEWALILPGHVQHTFVINLDRFKVADPRTQVAVPGWEGRLHTRVSNRSDYVLEHNGEDQVWTYGTRTELEESLTLFWEKFVQLGQDWLERL